MGADNVGYELSGHDRPEPDTSAYTLTIEEPSELFAEAGVPRNPRSIRRFCQHRALDCISIETPTSNRYLIRRSSVEKLILEKQQALSFSDAHRSPDMSGYDRPEPDTSGHDRTAPKSSARATGDDASEATIKRLEDDNMNLRIDNRAKEHVITMLRDERGEIQKQFYEVSYRLGAAEARVAQLEAPKQDEQDSTVAQFKMPEMEPPAPPTDAAPEAPPPQSFLPNAE